MSFSKHLRTLDHADGAAVLDICRGDITTLNETGAYIWRELQNEVPMKAIIEALAKDARMPHETVEQDVLAFLETLRERRLLDR